MHTVQIFFEQWNEHNSVFEDQSKKKKVCFASVRKKGEKFCQRPQQKLNGKEINSAPHGQKKSIAIFLGCLAWLVMAVLLAVAGQIEKENHNKWLNLIIFVWCCVIFSAEYHIHYTYVNCTYLCTNLDLVHTDCLGASHASYTYTIHDIWVIRNGEKYQVIFGS